MCLVSEISYSVRSSEDKLCYKVLFINKDTLISPYRNYKFNIGEVTNDIAEESIIPIFNVYMIESGFFHTYASPHHAKILLDKLSRDLPKCFKIGIFEAIIPKGTLYYKGLLGDLCSKSLKIIKEYD